MTEPLAEVVGRNCKRIRTETGITQDELARHARLLGLRWRASSVGDFEAGRSAPTFATVLVVGMALQFASVRAATLAELHGRTPAHNRVTLADLVGSDGLVALTAELAVPAADLAAVCRGKELLLEWWEPAAEPVARDMSNQFWQLQEWMVEQRSGLAEHRLAGRLGIKPAELAAASFRLWERTFSEERDRRAGRDANQQKKGRISRELRAELEKVLADGND